MSWHLYDVMTRWAIIPEIRLFDVGSSWGSTFSTTCDIPMSTLSKNSGWAIIAKITCRSSISVIYEGISTGFDYPTSAWRHLSGCDVISSMGDHSGEPVIWCHIVMRIDLFSHGRRPKVVIRLFQFGGGRLRLPAIQWQQATRDHRWPAPSFYF